MREWADLAAKGSFVLEGILDYWFTLQLHPLKPRVMASRLINISFVDGQGEEAHREFNKAEILTALVPEVELIFIPLSGNAHFWSYWIDVKNQQLYYADSLPSPERHSSAIELRPLIAAAFHSEGPGWAMATWPITRVVTPVQESCAIQVAQTFLHLGSGRPFPQQWPKFWETNLRKEMLEACFA